MKSKKGRYYYFIKRLMMSKQAVVNKIVTYKQQVFTGSQNCKRFNDIFVVISVFLFRPCQF